jgi:hypothetical protein
MRLRGSRELKSKTGEPGLIEVELSHRHHWIVLNHKRDKNARLDLGGECHYRIDRRIFGNVPNGDAVLPAPGGFRQAIKPQPARHAQRENVRHSKVVERLHHLPGGVDRQPAQRTTLAQCRWWHRVASADFSIRSRANETASVWLLFKAIFSTVWASCSDKHRARRNTAPH